MSVFGEQLFCFLHNKDFPLTPLSFSRRRIVRRGSDCRTNKSKGSVPASAMIAGVGLVTNAPDVTLIISVVDSSLNIAFALLITRPIL